MPEYAISKFRDPSRTQMRLRAAGTALLLAAVLAFMAFRLETKSYLISAPSGRSNAQTYFRMWFDTADDLVGAFWRNNHLAIERWSGANPAASWQFDVAPGDLWSMAADSSRVAWISGSNLYWQATAPGARPLHVGLKEKALALSLLPDASVAVAFDNSSVNRWDTATGRDLGMWHSPMPRIDHAAAEGNYVALSSFEEGKLRVFSFQNGQWAQAQEALAPELAERIVLPAPTVAGTMADGRLRVAGITLSSPGPIRAVAAHLYDVLAAGDFDGIYVLTPEEYYRLADAPRGSLVACGESHMAISNQQGTTQFNLGSEARLTRVGRRTSFGSLAMLLLGAALLCWPVLLQAFNFSFRIKRAGKKQGPPAAGKLSDVPANLVKACASGEMMLWAGAGLSAQSGFPLRASFIANALDSAIHEFADVTLAKKLRSLKAAGKLESALNELVAALPGRRGAILSHFTAVYARFSAPSRSHDALARLNLHSAVTTNYDILLEQGCEAWAANVVLPVEVAPSEESPAEESPTEGAMAGRFLLKLYGSLRAPKAVLLSQAEFHAVLNRPNIEELRQIFLRRPMLFLGCSIDSLLADLAAIGMPQDVSQIRFAVAGVSGRWQRTADELAQRFGVHVLPCPENQINEALPVFLDSLRRNVDEVRRGSRQRTATVGA